MATEIELKYLVLDQNVEEIVSQILTEQGFSFSQQTAELSNCYFDTEQQHLRALDFGLRVRSTNQHIEQTIKTAGIVVGGMHQRPEYNIDIDQTFPELALFPAEIWPEHTDVDRLQEQLISLFNTDFVRKTWLVQLGDSSIELAFDEGKVSAHSGSEVIREIEIELLKGHKKDLFFLANLLFSKLQLRPGLKSKAARGYALWQSKLSEQTELPELQVKKYTEKFEQNLQLGLSSSLQQLQLCVEAYIKTPQLIVLKKVLDALQMTRHGFVLYENFSKGYVDEVCNEIDYFIALLSWLENAVHLQELMNKTGNYRKKINYSEQLVEQLKLEKRRLPNAEQVIEFLHGERFNKLQLQLLQIAIGDKKVIDKEKELPSLYDFARQRLNSDLHALVNAMSFSDSEDVEAFLATRNLLAQCLCSGSWLGQLFDCELREQFRAPWLDIQQGLSELQSLWIIQQQLETLEDKPVKIVNWQQCKVENLLVALNHSLEQAKRMPAYWLN